MWPRPQKAVWHAGRGHHEECENFSTMAEINPSKWQMMVWVLCDGDVPVMEDQSHEHPKMETHVGFPQSERVVGRGKMGRG